MYIKITKGNKYAPFYYSYWWYDDTLSCKGSGTVDMSTYTEHVNEKFDWTDGNTSYVDDANLNTGLHDAIYMADYMLRDLYGGSIADLGFTAY